MESSNKIRIFSRDLHIYIYNFSSSGTTATALAYGEGEHREEPRQQLTMGHRLEREIIQTARISRVSNEASLITR
jgi:5-formaminoimidazole-4-carboxamide-1-beta-D-ribofuranosyl 5'-monophosphate synthetase